MVRQRRSPEAARADILQAAQELLLLEGPSALRLKRVAERVGMTHPGVLHHFGSVQKLLEALAHQTARELREDVLGVLGTDVGGEASARQASEDALARLSDPGRARLLAWLVASGGAPFPPEDERGLAAVVQGLERAGGADRQSVSFVVELAVLASLGDALFGESIRRRLGGEGTAKEARSFRERLIALLETELERQ